MLPVAKRPVFQLYEVQPEVRDHSNRTVSQRLVSELAEYKNQQPVSGVTVLEFWKKSKMSVLPKIARAFLSCQPTSTPSERNFSDGGYTLWDRRYVIL